MSPQRIQLRRTKGWRKPEGAVVVARPGRWGNPYKVLPADAGGWKVQGRGETSWSADPDQPWTNPEAARWAADQYRKTIPLGSIRASDAEVQLAGRDLACWCPLDQPCHADVLLEIANRSTR